MSLIAKLRGLTADEWKLMLWAMVLLPCVGLMFRIKGVQQTRRLFGGKRKELPASNTVAPSSLVEAQKISRMVNIAARRGVYRADCLKKCVVLEYLLYRRGLGCDLRIGVSTGQEIFGAHAWVEFCGEPLGESSGVGDAFAILQ